MEGRFSRFFERVLVFSTVVSLMLTFTSIFSSILNNAEVERILIDWFTYVIILASGIIFTIVLQIFTLERIKVAMHIVFIVFYIIAVLVICYFADKKNAPYVLIVTLLIQYFLQMGINDLFIFHDKFMLDCEEYEGKELEQYLFHNNFSAIDLTEKIKGQQAMMFTISCAMFIVLAFGKLSGGNFNPLTIVLVLIFYISVFICCFMLGIYKNEIYYAFLGFKDIIHNGKKLFASVMLIAAISCAAAFIFSSENSIIKIDYVEKRKEVQNAEIKIKEYNQPLPDFDFKSDLNETLGRDSKSGWIFDLIAEIIKYLAAGVLILLGVIFFIKPFFTRHFRSFWKEGRLFQILYDLWKEIKEFFKYVFSKDSRVSEEYSTVQSKKFHETMMDFMKRAKRSKEKIEEIDRLTKHFMKLIDWGAAKGFKYKPTLAPAEYTNMIPDSNAKIAGQLFEKALYDKEVLTGQEEKEFIDAINLIVR